MGLLSILIAVLIIIALLFFSNFPFSIFNTPSPRTEYKNIEKNAQDTIDLMNEKTKSEQDR